MDALFRAQLRVGTRMVEPRILSPRPARSEVVSARLLETTKNRVETSTGTAQSKINSLAHCDDRGETRITRGNKSRRCLNGQCNCRPVYSVFYPPFGKSTAMNMSLSPKPPPSFITPCAGRATNMAKPPSQATGRDEQLPRTSC